MCVVQAATCSVLGVCDCYPLIMGLVKYCFKLQLTRLVATGVESDCVHHLGIASQPGDNPAIIGTALFTPDTQWRFGDGGTWRGFCCYWAVVAEHNQVRYMYVGNF